MNEKELGIKITIKCLASEEILEYHLIYNNLVFNQYVQEGNTYSARTSCSRD